MDEEIKKKVEVLSETIEREIEKTRQRLCELENTLNAVKGLGSINVIGTKVEFPRMTTRRRIKGTKFSDVETKQIINLWNSLSPKMRQVDAVSKISGIMKQPYSRIYNKIHYLKKMKLMGTGINIKDIPSVETKPIATDKGLKIRRWSPEATSKLIEYTKEGKFPSQISKITGIDVENIYSKLNTLRREGILPKHFTRTEMRGKMTQKLI